MDTNIIPSNEAEDGKLLAILSHLWIVGTIIAWVLNLKKNNRYSAFYIRQMIGWHVFSFLNTFIFLKILDFGFLKWLIGVFLTILWVMSLIYSFSDKEKAIPVIGNTIQNWFKSL